MEKIKIFLDTNILVDYFSGRMHDGNALKIMQVGRTPQYELCTSLLSAVNTVYLRKYFNPDFRPSDIEKIVRIFPQSIDSWKTALKVPVSDFEDCLQITEAIRYGCVAIITRDHVYHNAPLKVYSPEDFLSLVTTA